MQSKPQARNGDASWFSARDLKIGNIINSLLQGEDVDVSTELEQVRRTPSDDTDATMDDPDLPPQSPTEHQGGSGGAGAGATGGDIRDEGEQSREGGADGGRA